jgi:hypothetical protein
LIFDLKDDDVLDTEDDVLEVLDVEDEDTTSSMSRTRSRTRSRTTTCVLDVEDVFDLVLDIEDLEDVVLEVEDLAFDLVLDTSMSSKPHL